MSRKIMRKDAKGRKPLTPKRHSKRKAEILKNMVQFHRNSNLKIVVILKLIDYAETKPAMCRP
jgi:hypothetical protein